MGSLRTRLLIAASGVLIAFLSLTGLALDQAFRESALVAVQERLQAQVFMLLGAADSDADGQLNLPNALPEARFSTPGSGLYAQVMDRDGMLIWRSVSLLGMKLPPLPSLPVPGQLIFQQIDAIDDTPLFSLNFTVSWEISTGNYRYYTFQVAETRRGFDDQVAGFRRSLWGWLLVSALVLLLVQGVILSWSLKPLRQVAREVREIEIGHQAALTGVYPRELSALTENLNTLIHNSQAHLERYRHALADLAHSLKTPLAVLRGAVEMPAGELVNTVQDQVERMNRTVEYQLQRAAVAGRTVLTAPVAVPAVARKVIDALDKVYRHKALQLSCAMDDEMLFYGDEGDLFEILGNLTDNACKWAKHRVAIRARRMENAGRMELLVEIEDDGPGIPVEQRSQILLRGARADPSVAGHGIGLAVVRNIVEEVYLGKLSIDSGRWGGALLRVRLRL
ncbi:MAG: ATP-binding protein [Candidatus Competibacteraceae bacterium]